MGTCLHREQVASTMEAFQAPLGNKFLGGSSPDINDRSAAEAAAQVKPCAVRVEGREWKGES